MARPRLDASRERRDRRGASRVRTRAGARFGLARAWLGLALVANALSDPETAERAFAAALKRDPQLSEAAFGLGLLCFEQRRYAEAVAHWRRAIAAGGLHALVHAGLGQALFFTGDFSGAAREMATQIAGGVGVDQKLTRRYALARFLEAAIVADDVAAFSAYREAAKADAEDEATVARTAFSLLSAYGHRDAAIRLGRARLPHSDDDPIQRYLFDAVVGEKLDRAPRDYLIAYFDRFADTFDKQLVDVLGYDVPEKLARARRRAPERAAARRRPRLRHRARRQASAARTIAARRRRPVAAHARQGGEAARLR